ncbi:shematrin-like protein 1 [Crassostrea angulata]|uniref:shematrin-like protein 1 n=1 Tax=Magallana angulata TaxID=2784310 RepID=UPI0022B08350|nr:shematrin-like protein 1 [Crassostrea angulata]
MISLLHFATLLGLTCATYPTYTTSGSYLPYTAAGTQGLGIQTLPYSTGGIGNVGLQTYFPSTYNTFGNGYYPSSTYLFNTASYPTVVSHYLYFPAGNPWQPGRNFIDLRVNPYPWYLGYYGGLGTGFGSTTFPGTYETFGSSLGYPTGGFLNNGLTGFPTAGFPTGYNFGLRPSYNTFTGNLGFGNYGYPGTGVGGYYPTGNLGGQIHRKKIY